MDEAEPQQLTIGKSAVQPGTESNQAGLTLQLRATTRPA